ncbi:MAG: thioredoxin family protein [bacterium]
MPEIKPLEDKDFEGGTLKDIEKMVVLFESPWCQGCNAIERMIAGMSDEESQGCVWGKVDISVHQKLAQRYGVLSLPTLLVFRNGKVAERMAGRISKEKLLSRIR